MTEKRCKFCGEKFEARHNNQQYCSQTCKRSAEKMRARKWQQMHRHTVRACVRCGKLFVPTKKRHIYCSEECQKPFEILCPICGKTFRSAKENTKYCSERCRKRAVAQMSESQLDQKREHFEQIKRMRLKEIQDKKRRGETLTIYDIALLASQAGVTYGQYVSTHLLLDS